MAASRQVRRWLANPRVRVLLLLVLLVLAVGLAGHLVGMADHSMAMGMIGGACLAVLAVGLLFLFRPAMRSFISLPAAMPVAPSPPPRLPPRLGRDPPDEGVVLLL